MSDSHVSGRVSYDADGNLWLYVPPNMVQIGAANVGAEIVYGPWIALDKNQDVPANGVWQVLTGGLEASQNGTLVRQVTLPVTA